MMRYSTNFGNLFTKGWRSHVNAQGFNCISCIVVIFSTPGVAKSGRPKLSGNLDMEHLEVKQVRDDVFW